MKRLTVFSFLFIVLFGCGSGSGGGTPGVTPTPSLVSISISPNLAFIGKERQFTASGLFSDETKTDITSSVLWSSNTPSVATVTSSGLVTGVSAGLAAITASAGLISDNISFNVESPWVYVSAGSLVSAGLKSDGSLWTWGYNTDGELGESRTNTTIPVRLGTGTWLAVSVGTTHVLAIKSDGTLWAWGDNTDGQLGNGSYGTTYNLAQQIGSDTTWISVSAGYEHSHAIKSDGSMWAWGNNGWGELGDGTTVDKHAPVQIGTATDWASVSAGAYHCIGLKNNGALFAWGDNGWGQLGNGTTNLMPTQGPTQIGTSIGWLSARAGWAYSLAIKSDGTLWAWGDNLGYVFGNGTDLQSNPTLTQIGTSTFHAAAGGSQHSLAIMSDGTLWGCGSNQYGQVGAGTIAGLYATVKTFTQVGSDTIWSFVSAGVSHSLAIKSDGTLWAWGDNTYGELGTGSTSLQANAPVLIYY